MGITTNVSGTVNPSTGEAHVVWNEHDEHGEYLKYVVGIPNVENLNNWSSFEYGKARIVEMTCKHCGFHSKYIHEWVEHECQEKELGYKWD